MKFRLLLGSLWIQQFFCFYSHNGVVRTVKIERDRKIEPCGMRSEEQTKRTTIFHAFAGDSDSGKKNATDSSDNVPPDPLTLPLPQPCIQPTRLPPLPSTLCPTWSLLVQVTSQLGCQIIFPFLSPPLGVVPMPMLPLLPSLPVCHSGSVLCPAFCNDMQRQQQRHQLHRQHHHQPSAIIIITRSWMLIVICQTRFAVAGKLNVGRSFPPPASAAPSTSTLPLPLPLSLSLPCFDVVVAAVYHSRDRNASSIRQ